MTRYTPQWLQQGSYSAGVDRRLIGMLFPTGAVSGCAVSVASGMTVNIAAGQVAVPTQNNTGSTLCTSDAVEQVTLSAAPAGGTNRYDLIVCQPRGNDLDGGANNDFVFAVVTGTAAASPTIPAVPAGQMAVAQIYVPGGSASITAGNIVDRRPGGTGAVPASYPRGFLGMANPTADQLLTTTQTPIGGMTVTVTPGINRRVRIRTLITCATAAGAPAGTVNVSLDDNAVAIGEWIGQGNTAHPTAVSIVNEHIMVVPNTGAHTYRTTAAASQTGMWFQYGIMSVEDIGL